MLPGNNVPYTARRWAELFSIELFYKLCIFSDSAIIPDDMDSVTVTVSGLVCERAYEIVAGGTDGSALVGPRIQQEKMVTAGSCPTPPPDMSTSMSVGM